MKIKNLFAIATILFASQSINAQNFFGLNNSNFNGINAIYFNPAGIADSRWKLHANAFCFDNAFQNNYASLEMPISVRQLLTGNVPDSLKNAQGQVKFNPNWIKENLDGKPKSGYFLLELRGPGVMKSLGKGMAVAFATRVRFGLNFSNVAEGILRFAKTANDPAGPNLGFINDNSFAINSSLYQEYSGSFAKVILNKDAYYLKLGGTAKYLQGLGAAYAINDGIQFHQSGDTIVIDRSNLKVGYSSPDFLNQLQGGPISAVMPSFKNFNGKGLGFDIGAIMEWRPKITDALTSNNRYLMKVGLSIMDIGAVNYKSKVINYSAFNTTPVKFTGDSSFNAAFDKGIDSGLAYMQTYAQQNFNYSKGPDKFKVSIPSLINLNFDVNVFKWFYVGVNWTQSLLSPTKVAFRRPSSIVVVPRFEHRLFEVSLPMSFYNDYKDAGMGMYLRVGPVYLGSDNLIKSINRTVFNGYDFYLGISTGIPTKKAKKKE